jgi:hypothetical protein
MRDWFDPLPEQVKADLVATHFPSRSQYIYLTGRRTLSPLRALEINDYLFEAHGIDISLYRMRPDIWGPKDMGPPNRD